MKIKPALMLCCLILSAAVCSCSETGTFDYQKSSVSYSDEFMESSERNLFAMDTLMTLKAYGENREKALSLAAEKITELEGLLSVTDSESEIRAVNQSEGTETELNYQTTEILKFALDIAEKTDGALNPAVYPVLREWGFTTGEYRIPDIQTIHSLLEKTDYRKIKLSDNKITLPADMLIDLGAAAKGYTGDAAAEIFRENGVTSAVVSLGGNVQTVGSKPDGTDWRVAVRDPLDENSSLCIVSVSDKAVVTSGNYERYFTGEDGKRYCHIINPSDGYPSDNGLASVTIVSSSGLLCDCLSTALFVKGKDGAYEYWNKYGGFEMILADTEGNIYITEELDKCTEVTGEREKTVLKRK